MLQRRSHKKSKNGCLPCKRQHIKCDEQLPLCLNCVRRDVDCVYTHSKATAHASLPLTHQLPSTLEVAHACTNRRARPHELAHHHRLLEMELMHRWSVHSWKGFCCVNEEQPLMQDEIPRKALAHPFLLYGIFAASALDIATSCRNDTSRAEHYGKIALRYYNMGSAQFRQQLTYIRPQIIHLLYLHAVIGACASLAIPPSLAASGVDDPPTVVQRVVTFFNMAIGLTSMLTAYRNEFEQSLKSVRVVQDLVATASSHGLSEDDETALQRLSVILRTSQLQGGVNSSEMKEKYAKCMDRLYLCFRVWSSHTMKVYCLSFPNFCGKQFVAAVNSSDPHALLLIMYWGIILHRSREEIWWIGSLGNELVQEIASAVLPMPLEQGPNVMEAVSWAVRQTEC